MNPATLEHPPVVSAAHWRSASETFLREEKEFTRQRARLAEHRRSLPWTKVEKPYVFTSAAGPRTLAELFDGRSQLIVYHFMLGAGWEEGCRGCSYVSDHFDGALAHLQARDVSFTAVSIAPLDEILRFKSRMGWKFNWVSSQGTPFNRDFGVSFTEKEIASEKSDYNFGTTAPGMEEMPGLTVFATDSEGSVCRTYSTYARGLDLLIGAYNLLDLVPKGRNEDPEAPMSWVRLHDRYGHAAKSA